MMLKNMTAVCHLHVDIVQINKMYNQQKYAASLLVEVSISCYINVNTCEHMAFYLVAYWCSSSVKSNSLQRVLEFSYKQTKFVQQSFQP